MKRVLAALMVLSAWLMPGEARADTAFIVSAANLQDQNGVLSPTTGLVLLVVDTGGDGFAMDLLPTTPLSVGSSLVGTDKPVNDRIVGAWNLSSLGTQGQLLNVTNITYDLPIAANQAVALYWFPSLTLVSTTPGSGTHFGFYTDATGIDGSAPWKIPFDGVNPANLLQLNFYTASRGGSNPDTAGRASHITWTDFEAWQIQYFGSTNNPNAAPSADADGTGQNNQFKYVAGLDPTNPASVFVVNITSVTNEQTWQNLIFEPIATGRTYSPQFNTDLVDGAWVPLPTYLGPLTNGNQVTVTDTNAVDQQEFYRINISLP